MFVNPIIPILQRIWLFQSYIFVQSFWSGFKVIHLDLKTNLHHVKKEWRIGSHGILAILEGNIRTWRICYLSYKKKGHRLHTSLQKTLLFLYLFFFFFFIFVVSSDFFCNFIYKVISLFGHTNYTHLFPLRCLIEYYCVIA